MKFGVDWPSSFTVRATKSGRDLPLERKSLLSTVERKVFDNIGHIQVYSPGE